MPQEGGCTWVRESHTTDGKKFITTDGAERFQDERKNGVVIKSLHW